MGENDWLAADFVEGGGPSVGWLCGGGKAAHGGSRRQVVQGGQHAREGQLVEVPAKYGFERQVVQRVAIFSARKPLVRALSHWGCRTGGGRNR